MRDVTKTKPSHYGPPAKAGAKAAEPARPTAPRTPDGIALGNEVRTCKIITEDTKTRIIREIIDYEITHGHVTKTFQKKVRKQLRGGPGD